MTFMSYTIHELEKLLSGLGFSYTRNIEGRDNFLYLQDKKTGKTIPFLWNGKSSHVIPDEIRQEIIEYIISVCDSNGFNK